MQPTSTDIILACVAVAWMVGVTLLYFADAGVFGEEMKKAVKALKGTL